MAQGYRASKNSDGTWNIHGVPIFASNKLRKVEVTREWQDRAVRKAQERFKAVGHIPPLHENHTGGSAKVRNLGFVVPTHVGTLKTVEEDEAGNLVTRDAAATYADFQRIPDADYQRIKRGELPYVSVEAGLSDHELHSAALLPNAPAIKTPPIAIATEEPATLVAAYSAEGGTVRTTMRFAAAMDEKPSEKSAPETPPTPPAAEKPVEAPKGEKPEDTVPKAEGSPDTPKAPETPGIDLTALYGQVAMLQSQVAALVAAAQKSAEAQTPAQPMGATKPSPMPYAATPETATGSTSISPEQFGALVAQVDILKAEAEAAKVARERDAKVRGIVTGLAADGFAVAPDLEPKLVAMASEKGMPVVEAYAAAIRTHGRKSPPSTIEGAIEAPEDPAMTEAFGSLEPGVRAKADQYAAQYEALNGASSLKKVDFVRALLRADRLIKE